MNKEWIFKNGSRILFSRNSPDPLVGFDFPYIFIEDNKMINVVVYGPNAVDIESRSFTIETKEDMIECLKELLNKCFYSGERICLESAEIDTEKSKSNFTEVGRW